MELVRRMKGGHLRHAWQPNCEAAARRAVECRPVTASIVSTQHVGHLLAIMYANYTGEVWRLLTTYSPLSRDRIAKRPE
ncbi:hypothetical protein J6590_021442 [Homalodisca vitripennis]|nr:hypothetical protein J6590_021442 [Homalodisca vitripennis]